MTSHISILSSGSESMHAPTTRKHTHTTRYDLPCLRGACAKQKHHDSCVLVSVFVFMLVCTHCPNESGNALFPTPFGSRSMSKSYRKEKVILCPHVISLHPFGPCLQSTLDLASVGKKVVILIRIIHFCHNLRPNYCID